MLLDGEKMSKSSGNFLMMHEAIDKFTTDATRFACACAGDTLEDANFDQTVANAAINNLYTEEEWATVVVAGGSDKVKLRPADADRDAAGTGYALFMDRAFANEIDRLIAATDAAFAEMRWRDGVICGFFEMQARQRPRSCPVFFSRSSLFSL